MNFFYDFILYNTQELVLIFFILAGVILSFLNIPKLNKFAFGFALFALISALISTLFINISFVNTQDFSMSMSTIFTIAVKLLILVSGLFIVIFSRNFVSLYEDKAYEYYTLILTGLLGSCSLVISKDFITAFISMEMIAVSSFILIGFANNEKAREGALKYLIQSCFATALFLFGASYLYGISGSLDFIKISEFCATGAATFFYPALGLIAVSGIMFKLGCVPFTNWIPDIYEGSSYPVGAYLSLIPKIAGFAFLAIILSFIFPQMSLIKFSLEIIALISVLYGASGALKQTNIKRLWGYSSIIQSGFILSAAALMSVYSLSSVIFYLTVYIFMNLGVWAASYQFNLNTGSDLIDDYRGLYKKRPYFSAAFLVCILSLAGLPITSGFLAKIYLFSSLLKQGTEYICLLFLLLLFSLIAIYAYFGVIKNIFSSSSKLLEFNFKYKTFDMILYLFAFVTIILCIMPNFLIKLSQITAFYIK